MKETQMTFRTVSQSELRRAERYIEAVARHNNIRDYSRTLYALSQLRHGLQVASAISHYNHRRVYPAYWQSRTPCLMPGRPDCKTVLSRVHLISIENTHYF